MNRDTALGQALREWRDQHGVKQKGLAQQLGTNRQRIWNWETRGVPTGDVTFVRLALRQLEAESRINAVIAALKVAIAGLNALVTDLQEN